MSHEIYLLKQDETTLSVAGGIPVSLRRKNIEKKGARVFEQGKIYASSFVGEISDKRLIQIAKDNPNTAIAYDYELPQRQSLDLSFLAQDRTQLACFNQEYQNNLEQLKKKHPKFIFSGKCSHTFQSTELVFDDRQKQSVVADRFSWHYIVKHKQSANLFDSYVGLDSLGSFDFSTAVNIFSQQLDTFDQQVALENGFYPVVIAPDAYLMTQLLSGFMIDKYENGLGLFAGKKHTKILHEKINLIDSHLNPLFNIIHGFDGEGVVRTHPDLYLVKNGVFNETISDLRNAKKYNTRTSGNGIRSFNSPARLDFNTTFFKPSSSCGLSQTLAQLDQCIFIKLGSGGSCTAIGDFSTPLQMAYLIKKGQIVGRLPQLTASASLYEFFGKDLIEICVDDCLAQSEMPVIVSQMNILNNEK